MTAFFSSRRETAQSRLGSIFPTAGKKHMKSSEFFSSWWEQWTKKPVILVVFWVYFFGGTNATLLERSRIRFPAHLWVYDSMILTFSQLWDIYPRSQGGSLLLILGPNEQKMKMKMKQMINIYLINKWQDIQIFKCPNFQSVAARYSFYY